MKKLNTNDYKLEDLESLRKQLEDFSKKLGVLKATIFDQYVLLEEESENYNSKKPIGSKNRYS